MTLEEYKNEIKELRERIKKLEAEKVEEPQPPKRWKPEQTKTFWYVNGDVWSERWSGCPWDEFQYTVGNCFKTEAEAEEYRKKIEYTARYKNYIEEHSEPLDWKDPDKCKYAASYNFISEEIDIGYAWSHKNQGVVYASSEQILLDAICKIGRSNFKKYVLEVK